MNYLALQRNLVKALADTLRWVTTEDELEAACVDWIMTFSSEALAPYLYKSREETKKQALEKANKQVKRARSCFSVQWVAPRSFMVEPLY